jgi:hypothetical protein
MTTEDRKTMNGLILRMAGPSARGAGWHYSHKLVYLALLDWVAPPDERKKDHCTPTMEEIATTIGCGRRAVRKAIKYAEAHLGLVVTRWRYRDKSWQQYAYSFERFKPFVEHKSADDKFEIVQTKADSELPGKVLGYGMSVRGV